MGEASPGRTHVPHPAAAGPHREARSLTREVEYKFTVHPSFIVPRFNGEGGVTATRELSTLELTSTYFDTPDLRLARSGVTLRHRLGETEEPVWTLKLPNARRDAMVREEIDFQAAAGEEERPPDDAIDLALAFHRGDRLEPVARLVTLRRRWSLLGKENEELAEIADDEVSIIENDRMMARFHELELEARGADEDRLSSIAGHLRRAGAMPAEPIPKAVRALGPRATAPSDIVPPPELDEDRPAGTVVKAALARGVGRLVANDPRARLGDPEGVHQMRVAARRLRSDLRTFEDLVDPGWKDALVDELKQLASSLGEVRDLDVMKQRLEIQADDLRDELKPLFTELDRRERTAHSRLMEVLRGPAYRDLLARLLLAAREPSLTAASATRIGDLIPGLVRPMWLRASRDARDLDRDASAERLHDVRVRFKRVRYAAESVAPAMGARSKTALSFARRAAAIQDVLGEHQDAVVAARTVLQVALDSDDASFQLAAGRLIERECQAASRARSRWPKAWKNVKDKKVASWLTG
ncbi:MAG: CHAD domain-containing protein [Chloroflexi bacterium]|nr:CHAD domain-containing protein [Chloroflexota bacterium]